MKSLLIAAVGIFLVLPVTVRADPMTFHTPIESDSSRFARIVLHGGKELIYGSGEIDLNTADRLNFFVRAQGLTSAKIIFNSGGGSLIGGLLLGETIRDLGFDTGVGAADEDAEAICASACAYAFSGGVNRFFADEDGLLGLHQFYGAGSNITDAGDTQEVSAAIVGYLGRMGVSPRAFIRATDARADEMIWLSSSDAVELGLANNGSLPTTSEIKLFGMLPYLRLEQMHHDVAVRVLLSCDNRQVRLMFGIVTERDLTAMRYETAIRSYLDFDDSDRLIMSGQNGLRAEDSVLWIQRSLTGADASMLARTQMLNGWVENGGAFRWGGNIDLSGKSSEIQRFVTGCIRA